MKIRLSLKFKQMASALLVVMVLGGILCLSVVYYLSLIQQQNTLSVRSQAWNIAIAVTEAGIEEGLQALNSNLTILSTADGWHLDATGTMIVAPIRVSHSAATGTPSPSGGTTLSPTNMKLPAGPM